MKGFVFESKFSIGGAVGLQSLVVVSDQVIAEVLGLNDGLTDPALERAHIRNIVGALVLKVVDVTKGLLVAPCVHRVLALEVVTELVGREG